MHGVDHPHVAQAVLRGNPVRPARFEAVAQVPQLVGELKYRSEPDGSFLTVVLPDFQRDRVIFVVPGHVHPHVAAGPEYFEFLGTVVPEGKGALRADLAGELELRRDGLGHL